MNLMPFAISFYEVLSPLWWRILISVLMMCSLIYEKHYVHQPLLSKIEIKSSQTFFRLLKFNLHQQSHTLFCCFTYICLIIRFCGKTQLNLRAKIYENSIMQVIWPLNQYHWRNYEINSLNHKLKSWSLTNLD